jgi:excisionase family DNA binding protein
VYKDGMPFITTNDAAHRLQVSRRRVLALIADGRLPAQKMGRDFLIEEADLALVANRQTGRPKKAAENAPATKKRATKRG